jgi:hypothetical protein
MRYFRQPTTRVQTLQEAADGGAVAGLFALADVELLPYLEEAFERAAPGTVHVVTR